MLEMSQNVARAIDHLVLFIEYSIQAYEDLILLYYSLLLSSHPHDMWLDDPTQYLEENTAIPGYEWEVIFLLRYRGEAKLFNHNICCSVSIATINHERPEATLMDYNLLQPALFMEIVINTIMSNLCRVLK